MTDYGSKQLADTFRTVRKNTIAIAEEIPQEQYGERLPGIVPHVTRQREAFAAAAGGKA